MMGQRVQSDQIVLDSRKSAIGSAPRQEYEALMTLVDDKLKKPGNVELASVSGDAILHIDASPLQKLTGNGGGDDQSVSGAGYDIIAGIDNNFRSYPESYLDVSTGGTSGGIDVGTVPSTTDGYWRWMLVSAKSDEDKWALSFGEEVSGMPVFGSSMPVVPSSQSEIAFVRLQNSGGGQWNYSRPGFVDIFKVAKGGGSSSSSSGRIIYAQDNFDAGISNVSTTDATNMAIAAETVNPLRGLGSLKITVTTSVTTADYVTLKSWTVDKLGAGQKVGINFWANLSDANYSDNDLGVIVYNTTQSTFVTLSSLLANAGTDAYLDLATLGSDGDAMEVRLVVNSVPSANYVACFDNYLASIYESSRGFIGWAQYNHGTDFTITCSTSTISTVSAVAIPYKTLDGVWRIRANVDVLLTAGSINDTFQISGVTFKTGIVQAGCMTDGSNNGSRVFMTGGNSNFSSRVSSADASKTIAFDVELDSQPTWAIDTSNILLSSEASARDIYVSAGNSAGTTIVDGNKIPYVTEVNDTCGCWNTDTFTAPESGNYNYKFVIHSGYTSYTSSEYLEIDVVKNSTAINITSNYGNAAASGVVCTGEIYLNAGDTLHAVFRTNVAGKALIVLTTLNNVQISKQKSTKTIAYQTIENAYDLTVAGTSWITGTAEGIVYRVLKGGAEQWRMRFNIQGGHTASSSRVLTVTGVTFAYSQAIVGYSTRGDDAINAYVNSAASTINIDFTGSSLTTTFGLSGDVALSGKPTFAV